MVDDTQDRHPADTLITHATVTIQGGGNATDSNPQGEHADDTVEVYWESDKDPVNTVENSTHVWDSTVATWPHMGTDASGVAPADGTARAR